MQKRKISIILAIAVGLNMLSGPLVALAEELQIQTEAYNNQEKTTGSIKKFSLLNSENIDAYNQRFKLHNSKLKTITNKSNNNDFNNEIELEFKDRVTLDRVVYGARQSDTKGFAEEFEIYGSNTNSGDTYNLVTTGKYNRVSGLIEAKFEPTEFKRLKFKFTKSNQNWATLNEILFYKEDKLKNMLPNIFIDGTMTDLKEEYKSKETIAENIYTKESFSNLIAVQDNVLESLKDGYNQVEIDRLLKELKEAKKALIEIVNYDVLEETINDAKEVKGYLYTKESYTNFKNSLEKAEKMVADKISSILEVSEMINELKSNIESLEMFEGKEKLENLVDEAYKITDISMIGGTEDREYRWAEFVENRLYAREVLFDINATYQDVNSVSLFLKISLDDLMIVN